MDLILDKLSLGFYCYMFVVSLDKSEESCNTPNELSDKIRGPDKRKYVY